MNISKITKNILSILSSQTTDGAHNTDHVLRVQKIARYIAEKEHANKEVLEIAALVHDEHRVMEKELGRLVHPRESLPRVKKILLKARVNPDIIPQILHCVENHELWYGKWMGGRHHTIEVQVLQDADALDGLGAIGIGRCFTYCAHSQLPMYDEKLKLGHVLKSGKDPSFIHHMHQKYLKKSLMCNTKTGKMIAVKRTTFMKKFYDEFLKEWAGSIKL